MTKQIVTFILVMIGMTNVLSAQETLPVETASSLPPSRESAEAETKADKKQTSIDPIPEGEFVYTGGRYDKHVFRYRIHIPEMEAGKTYPLILWLHGYGNEINDNNTSQLGHSQYLFSKGTEKKSYPFFVLFPQCPKENPGWYASGKKEDRMATVSLAMLDDLCAKYPVDENRIILFGISGGGTCCWRMLAENPLRFAVVVPTAAGPCEPSWIESIPNDVPVWAFIYDNDPAIRPDRVRQTIKAMRDRGVPVELTEFSGTSHNAWLPAFRETDVSDWMLLQERGKYLWYPPNMAHWPVRKWSVLYSWFSCTWLPVAVILGFVAVRADRRRKLLALKNRESVEITYEKERYDET